MVYAPVNLGSHPVAFCDAVQDALALPACYKLNTLYKTPNDGGLESCDGLLVT